jgi:hypothetical protein
VAQRDKHLLQVLIGVVCALLIVDVLALIFMVAPLRALQQARADTASLAARPPRTTMDQALILPTHDPRKPWGTRTPRQTSTPRLIHTATSAPVGNATQMPTNAPAPGTEPSVPDAVAPVAPSPTARAIRPTSASSPTPTSRAAIVPTGAPTVVAVLLTTASDAPTGTPEPTQAPDPSQSPPSITPGDEAQFQAYVQYHYSSVAGQPLAISAVIFDTTEAGLPRITIRVAGDDAAGENTGAGFGAGPKERYYYGYQLLEDAKLYFNTQSCAIAVVGEFEAFDPDACLNAPSWCTVGEHNQDNNSWPVKWIYVLGASIDGANEIQIWI